jgi:type I restriction enzyme M protein
MAKTKATEPEFQGEVLVWIKRQIEQGGLPFENATIDSSLYGLERVKFPDIMLTLDPVCQRPFCGWELKTPKTDARDKELLKDAVKKAQTLGAKYFVTWNMQTAIIWRTAEKSKATVTEKDKVREFGPDQRIQGVDDIRDPQKSLLMESVCAQLLRDLARLYKDENINLPLADTTVFVGLVANASKLMSEALVKDINKARAKKDFDKRLNAWAKIQGVSKYDQDYYKTLAQQVAYKIVGKILFYLTLHKHRSELPRMELPAKSYKTALKKMRGLFQQALEVDYQAIFEPDITDEIELSQETAKIIIELTDKLEHWSFELMPLDVIGAVFEKLIPEDARHSLGQYFTPNNLVDLIVSFCVRNGEDYVMDPTCGTGTFLIRCYNKLRSLIAKRKTHHELLNQVWGFDIAGFPAELATINLYRQDLSDYQNFPRVLSADFFEVMPGQRFEFPPPKKTVKAGDRIPEKIPKFDALMGNFPYIRQELIEKAAKGYKKKLERILFEDWGKEYRQLFSDGKIKLSGQADIYAYLFFHAAAHLKQSGRMGFVTSNSWLDVAYGYELQRFFLSRFKIVAICESRCEPWFEQSAVNTVFTILERCDDEQEKKDNPVYFVKVKKPLAQLFSQDALTDAQERWNAIDRFVGKIEELGTRAEVIRGKDFKKFEPIRAEYVRQPEIISYEDDEVRVRIIKQKDLKEDVEAEQQTVKWGQYLRGPDIYFEILEKCADKLVPLREVAEIRRGFTTGINEFFYLMEDKIKHWGIEEEFLKPVLKSPKEFKGILIEPAKLTTKVFLCQKSKEELRREGKTGALKYIKWGEKQKTKDGVPWPDVPTVRSRKPGWWALQSQELPQLVWVKGYDKTFREGFSQVGFFADQQLYPIYPKESFVTNDLLSTLMNNTLFFMSVELGGRIPFGDGVLWTTVEEATEYSIIPRVDGLSKTRKLELQKSFMSLITRPIKPIFEEVKMPDHQRLDSLVLEALDLDPKKYLKPLYDGLCELVRERLLLPRLRSAKKKRREEQDLAKLKEEIAEEVLSDGPRKFPDGFIKGWPRVECKEIGVPAGALKLGGNFMGKQEVCDDEGEHLMEVESEEKGKFILYAKKRDELVIKVPERSIVIKKAVHDYEMYLRDLKQNLYTAFMEKCGDLSVSENLTRQVFEDFGLPDTR